MHIFRIKSMYIEYVSGLISLFLSVLLVSYRDLNLQNANWMTYIQDFAITFYVNLQCAVYSSRITNVDYKNY